MDIGHAGHPAQHGSSPQYAGRFVSGHAQRTAFFGGPPNDDEDFAEAVAMVEDGVLPIDYVGGFFSQHPFGANFLLCDGAVRFVRTSVNRRIYQLLGNRSDGELISDDAF